MDLTGLSLSDLATQLRSRIDAQDSLSLGKGLLGSDALDEFLATLPDQRIVIHQPQFDVAVATWPQRLTVTGQVAAAWPVSAFAPHALGVERGVLLIARDHDGAPVTVNLEIDGRLHVSTLELAVTGHLVDDSRLRCSLLTTGSHAVPDLPELVGLLSNAVTSIALPADLPFTKNLQVSKLDLLLGFGPTPLTSLVMDVDAAVGWTIVEDKFVLEAIGVTLVVSPGATSGEVAFGTVLHASVLIGRRFDLSLQLGGGPVWTLEIVPADGALPSLADLAGLIGGTTLQGTVQSGLDAIGLGELSIDGVRISFDPFGHKLHRITVASHLILAGVRIDLITSLPDFEFGGSLAPDASIHLKQLFEHFFGTASGFPDIVLTELGFQAYPSAGSYELELAAEDDDLTIGPIGFQQMSIRIEKTPTGVTGTVGAGIVIGGALLIIEASHPDAGGPWVFNGTTGPGQEIAIATIHADLARQFGAFTLPAVIEDLVIDELSVRFDTSKNFTFTLGTSFPVSAKTSIHLKVFVDVIAHEAAPSDVVLKAAAIVGDLRFEVDFSRVQGAVDLLAVYSANPKKPAQNLSDLLAPVLKTEPEVAALIPDSLRIELKDAYLFIRRPAATTTTGSPTPSAKFLFGLDLGASIDLAQLPLVGRTLPAGRRAVVQDLQAILASQDFNAADVTAVNGLLPAGVTPLPAVSPPTGPAATGPALARGVTFGAVLILGGTPSPLALPASPGAAPASPGQGQTVSGQPVVQADTTQWITLQRTFGPIHLNRVGFQYAQQKLWFLLDAGISLGGLTFSLDGLAVGSSITAFSPEFDLRGVGLDYASGPLTIGAALLRARLTGPDGQPYDEYEGSAQLKLRALSLTALGAYAYVGGYPSLFVYAVLDYPLGGPAFFFVTGVAAGFGYNRRLQIPAIDQIAQFPLVSEVVGGATGAPSDPLAELAKLRSTVVPAQGEEFLAVGIRFSSFKQIDTFALLTVLFGQRFEVDVLGLSTMKLPTGAETPLAEVQMAVKATVIPAEGFLGVQAQLTSASYVFSRDCHLTGGFAFFSWFSGDHAGDFVVTVGGYRPGYSPPAHYPRVPRAGINWQVNSELSIKGELYFALLPSALMAGGQVRASWNSGNFSAWFDASFDFLIAWKPYHYQADLHIGIGVRYTYQFFGTHTLSADANADLSIWGPDFSGRARVRLSIVSFDVAFGAGASAKPAPIDWPEFQQSFLPADTDKQPICGLTVRDGLTRPGDGATDWVLDPKTFTIVTDSVIPTKRYDVAAGQVGPVGPAAPNTDFGVAPMDVPASQLDSIHHVVITRGGTDVSHRFAFTPVRKKVPSALWGQSVQARADRDALIEDTLAGFAITPLAPVQPSKDATETLGAAQTTYETTQLDAAFGWQPGLSFAAAGVQSAGAAAAALAASAARSALLADLGITADVTVGGQTVTAFLLPPQVGNLIGHPEDSP